MSYYARCSYLTCDSIAAHIRHREWVVYSLLVCAKESFNGSAYSSRWTAYFTYSTQCAGRNSVKMPRCGWSDWCCSNRNYSTPEWMKFHHLMMCISAWLVAISAYQRIPIHLLFANNRFLFWNVQKPHRFLPTRNMNVCLQESCETRLLSNTLWMFVVQINYTYLAANRYILFDVDAGCRYPFPFVSTFCLRPKTEAQINGCSDFSLPSFAIQLRRQYTCCSTGCHRHVFFFFFDLLSADTNRLYATSNQRRIKFCRIFLEHYCEREKYSCAKRLQTQLEQK